jgi:CRISPR system Cascade subunit CasE
MLLSRIHLNPRCREVRRDLADPYQMHATLCRAFGSPDKKVSSSDFLWRLEPETDGQGRPLLLVQSLNLPDWSAINIPHWLGQADPPLDLRQRLGLEQLSSGKIFRFRLRANPSVMRQGKRLGLLKRDEQEKWLLQKGRQYGFIPARLPAFHPDTQQPVVYNVRISQERMLRGRQHDGNIIKLFSVLYDGILRVTEPSDFVRAIEKGIGHGKAMGLGLLSVVPLP